MPEPQATPHPYYPRDLSLPGYRPNRIPLSELLGLFFGLVAIALSGTWILAGRYNKQGADRIVICWFVACGFIHCVLEGYFAANHETLIGGGSYLAEMWKEYGHGDSRYLTSDPFVVCMETITAVVDGPLSFAAAIAHLTGSRHRYPLQLVVSLCQLYGDTLYMCIEYKEGFVHGEFGHPLHFWFYFVFLNLFWIVVPLLLIIQAYRALVEGTNGDIRRGSAKKKK
uniref:3-beta-hydroxysteroid-Delta(8), Delta(7)-isomerase-like n=1 Tax=Crassostrea virginica TaxID=6565 RepID=A0A8B8BF33_CRAVI|nr:3-beta-hydroxysteroid-Delta(8),Delta(7)-isomerase-like [Crassostrea virginica]